MKFRPYLLIIVVLAAAIAGLIFWQTKTKHNLGCLLGEPKIIDGWSIVSCLDKALIAQKIEQGKEFLLTTASNETEHGFYKKYDAANDFLEDRLHTVYSASIIYTLLKVYDFDGDKRILENVPKWADFLLSMQSKEEKTNGAFHYSYYFKKQEKEQKFVVGTAALSIFTLLDLYQRTDQARYLEATRLAGDWLLTMQKENGVLKPYKRYTGEKWLYGKKESLLYNGQVLSALSRLYRVTREERYFQAAQKIVSHFTQKVSREGCYLGDDYRSPNPISSAWVVMSLLDFYQVKPSREYKEIILKCSKELLERQKNDPSDPLDYGRWQGALSTSGNGWLAEVMMEVYHFCQEQGEKECDKYKEAVVKVIRWLLQNTYSKDNASFLPAPEKAIGGLFWNYQEKYIRTDSVCHGLNAYLGILNDLPDGILLGTVPPKRGLGSQAR